MFKIFIISLLLGGCSSYRVPLQTQCHPACPGTTSSQIELSPILEIDDGLR